MYFPTRTWDFTPLAGFGRLRAVLIFLTLFYLVLLAENSLQSPMLVESVFFLFLLYHVMFSILSVENYSM